MNRQPVPDAREIVRDVLRRQNDGEVVDRQEIVDHYRRLAEQLQVEFEKLNWLPPDPPTPVSTPDPNETVRGDDETAPAEGSDSDPPVVQAVVRCPHCNSRVEASLDESMRVVPCSQCDQEFTLVKDREWPSIVGHFQLIERLGMGGFGTVWRAFDTSLEREVALKLPRHRHYGVDEAEMFLREARAAGALRHPNIVRVLQCGQLDDEVYIASELVEGRPLTDSITVGLREDEALPIAIQLADALQHAHQRKVIHRDLKPQNVLMDQRGTPHLTDFGLAGHFSTDVTVSGSGRFEGTPNYMSPEQARAEMTDERTDIYSFGVLMYEMLTGRVPFGGTITDILRSLESDVPVNPRQVNDGISRDLDTICMKCLEKEPERRYQTGQELKDELQRVADGKPIQARPVGFLEQSYRWCKRNRLKTMAIVASVFALFVFIIASALLYVQRQYIASVSLAKLSANLSEVLAEQEVGYRDKIFDLVRKNPQLPASPVFRDATRDIVLSSLGDPLGFAPQEVVFPEEQTAITAAISEGGKCVAVSYDDGRLEIRRDEDLTKAKTVLELPSGEYPVRVQFPGSTQDTLIAISSRGSVWRVHWSDGEEATEATVIANLPEMQEVATGWISQDGNRVAACHDQKVCLFDLEQQVVVLQQVEDQWEDGFFRSVAASEDGRYLAALYRDNLRPRALVCRWELGGSTINYKSMTMENASGFYEYGTAFSHSGDALAIGSTQLLSIETESMQQRQYSKGDEAAGVAFTPDDAYLAIAYSSDDIAIRHRDSNSVMTSFRFAASGISRGVAFDSTGDHLLAWNGKCLEVLRFRGTPDRTELAGHTKGVPLVRFTKSGNKLISLGKDGVFAIWDLETETCKKKNFGATLQCLDINPQSGLYALPVPDENSSILFLDHSLQTTGQLYHNLGEIISIRYSQDGQYLAASGQEGLRIWQRDESGGFDELAFADERGDGRFVCFTPNDRRAYYAHGGYRVAWVDLPTFEKGEYWTKNILKNGYNSLFVDTRGHLNFVSQPGELQQWQMDGMTPQLVSTLENASFSGSTVHYDRPRDWVLGTTDGRAAIWDLATGRELYEFRNETNTIWSLAMHEDLVAVGTSDGGIAIWHLSEVEEQLKALGFDRRGLNKPN